MADRLAKNPAIDAFERQSYAGNLVPSLRPKELYAPLHLRKPAMIGVQFMGDLFHESIPDEIIDKVVAVIASKPNHIFVVLTKRPHRAASWYGRVRDNAIVARNIYQSSLIDFYQRHGVDLSYPHQVPALPTGELRFLYDSFAGVKPTDTVEDRPLSNIPECHWREWPLSNLWLGVTVENQARADERIPILLQIPAAKRWISLEPMLGAVDLRGLMVPEKCERHDGPWLLRWDALTGFRSTTPYSFTDDNPHLDWVVLGGETGPGARPAKAEWFLSVIEQCKAAGVPVFVKNAPEGVPIIRGYPI